MEKALSVIIAALDTYGEIQELHRCIEKQTIRPKLEVIFICRTKGAFALPESFEVQHPDIILIQGGKPLLLHEARHLGIMHSTAPHVVIMEDHCLPLEDCLEHMLNRLLEGWSGVGPSIRNGNRVSAVSRAANYVTYGEWMGRKASGEMHYIAGYNSAFSRAVLLSRRELLEQDLIATSLMQMSLRKQGHRFFLETRAVMYHWEASCWQGTKRILIPNGQALGLLRSRGWGTSRRLWFSALAPCLFIFRYARALRTYLRVVKKDRVPEEFLYLLPITLIWSFGELKGYWTKDTRVFQTVSDVERNRSPFLRPEEAIILPESWPVSTQHSEVHTEGRIR
ncbi:MAG: glycosyltransferase [Pseudomonadota bacterium]